MFKQLLQLFHMDLKFTPSETLQHAISIPEVPVVAKAADVSCNRLQMGRSNIDNSIDSSHTII